MFSLDLDHLNILIMLIITFFSFRAYQPDSNLSIQSSCEEQSQENQQNIQNYQEQMKDENQPNFNLEPLENEQNPLQQVNSNDQLLRQFSVNLNEQFKNDNIQINGDQQGEMENQIEKIIIAGGALKYEEADSTNINRDSLLQNELYMNNSDEEHSDSHISSILSSSSSKDDSVDAESSIRKKKQIQKNKKKAKREIKRNEVVSNIKTIEI